MLPGGTGHRAHSTGHPAPAPSRACSCAQRGRASRRPGQPQVFSRLRSALRAELPCGGSSRGAPGGEQPAVPRGEGQRSGAAPRAVREASRRSDRAALREPRVPCELQSKHGSFPCAAAAERCRRDPSRRGRLQKAAAPVTAAAGRNEMRDSAFHPRALHANISLPLSLSNYADFSLSLLLNVVPLLMSCRAASRLSPALLLLLRAGRAVLLSAGSDRSFPAPKCIRTWKIDITRTLISKAALIYWHPLKKM